VLAEFAAVHSRMNAVRRDSIKVIGQSVGIADLNDNVAEMMAQDVEFRIREIIQDAAKFMRHSHRRKLTAQDIDSALRLRNVESLYGYSSSDPLAFRQAQGTDDLFFVEDTTIRVDHLLREPLAAPPPDPTFSVHWLAIEGVQPVIPENPHPLSNLSSTEKSAALLGGLAPEEAEKARQVATSLATGLRGSDFDLDASIRRATEHVLSKEQQLFFDHVTSAIKSEDAVVKSAVLSSLSSDAGLYQLVPYFTQFIADEVANNLSNLPILTSLMQMSYALIHNSQLNIEPYLHQLCPPILSCLVGKRLCSTPAEDHWTLREFSANLIAFICQKFGRSYSNLQPRITRTLAKAFLDASKPLTTHFGAIVGLAKLGPHVVKALILPHLKPYMKLLEPEFEADNPIKRLETRHCYGALLAAVGLVVRFEFAETEVKCQANGRTIAVDSPALPLPMNELFDMFGESLYPYAQSSSCFRFVTTPQSTAQDLRIPIELNLQRVHEQKLHAQQRGLARAAASKSNLPSSSSSTSSKVSSGKGHGSRTFYDIKAARRKAELPTPSIPLGSLFL